MGVVLCVCCSLFGLRCLLFDIRGALFDVSCLLACVDCVDYDSLCVVCCLFFGV